MRCPKCKAILAEFFHVCPDCQTDLREISEFLGPFYEPHPEVFADAFLEVESPREDFLEEEEFFPSSEEDSEDIDLGSEEPLSFEAQEDLDLEVLGEEELSPLGEEVPEFDLSSLEAEEETAPLEEQEAAFGVTLEEVEEPLEEIHEDLLSDLDDLGDLLPEDLEEKEAT